MNDIADAKASLADQLTILKRKQNWIMCVLYTGTFGSFIGYAAGLFVLYALLYNVVRFNETRSETAGIEEGYSEIFAGRQEALEEIEGSLAESGVPRR